MDLRETVWEGASGSGLWPMAGSCEHINRPSVSWKVRHSLTSSITVSFSGRTVPHGVR